MPKIPDTFWTDNQQAIERLADSFVLYDEDVVRVTSVSPKGNINFINMKDQREDAAPMSSASWRKFRILPRTGWLNAALTQRGITGSSKKGGYIGAVYLCRRAVRSRIHGLNNTNTVVYDFFTSDGNTLQKSRVANIDMVYACGTYNDPQHYPSFREAFPLLQQGMSVALCPKFALYKDQQGLTWLYRKRKCVALVPDISTILLLKTETYYREDIAANYRTVPVQIKEL